MNGLCAPAEQGNKVDGLWLEHKEVLRLRKIAVNYEAGIRRATFRGVLIGVTVAFLLTALLNSGTVHAEDKWTVIMHDIYEDVATKESIKAGEAVEKEPVEQCFSPYAPVLYPEFEVQNVGITVHWYDSKEEMQDDLGDLFPDRDYSAASQCEKKPEFNISYCDIYVVRPTMVDDNATLSIGHEVLHGLIGDFHD